MLKLNEREGRVLGNMVVAVGPRRSEFRTKTTEGQYSPNRSRASEVSKFFMMWWHRLFERSDTSGRFSQINFPRVVKLKM